MRFNAEHLWPTVDSKAKLANKCCGLLGDEVAIDIVRLGDCSSAEAWDMVQCRTVWYNAYACVHVW